MPRIVFRADANDEIGTGDLKSLIYLSHEFSSNLWEPFFIIRDYEPALKITRELDLQNVFVISKDATIEDEVSFIKRFCLDKQAACLFMEITERKLTSYSSLVGAAPIKACVNFDGVITEDFDLVINWCVSSEDRLYETYKGRTRFILGFENTILPLFNRHKILNRKYSGKIKRILVTMGGVDSLNLTARIVRALAGLSEDHEVRVIVGAGYSQHKSLSEFMQGRFAAFQIKVNISDLLEDYLWSDMAFSAGGLTSSELVATRTPAVIIAACQHQVQRCEFYDKHKWACYAGNHSRLEDEDILNCFFRLKKEIEVYKKSLASVNFKGANEKIFKDIDSYRQSKQLVS